MHQLCVHRSHFLSCFRASSQPLHSSISIPLSIPHFLPHPSFLLCGRWQTNLNLFCRDIGSGSSVAAVAAAALAYQAVSSPAASLLAVLPAGSRPWHPALSMFSKGFSPVGNVAMKVFPGHSAACYVLYPVWAALLSACSAKHEGSLQEHWDRDFLFVCLFVFSQQKHTHLSW